MEIPYISGSGSPKKASYISGNGTFQYTPRKFLIFHETEAPKKLLIFSQKKAVLILQETETPKKSFHFRKRNFLILPETELSYILRKVYSEGIFITRIIFRTTVYLRHIQKIVKHLR